MSHAKQIRLIMVIFAFIFLFAAEGMVVAAADVQQYYVSTEGDDGWSGTVEQPTEDDGPLATLHAARDAVRKLKESGEYPEDGVEVIIAGGTYRLERPIRMDGRDSGEEGRPVIYRAAAGENVVLAGDRPLDGFRRVEEEEILTRMAPGARENVLRVSLPENGVEDPGSLEGGYKQNNENVLQLYWDGELMSMARWPDDGFARIGEKVDDAAWHYEADAPEDWVDEPEVWLHGFFYFDWFDTRLKVEDIDPEEKIIDVGNVHPRGVKEGQWYRAFNLLPELSRPGEWCVDHDAGEVYFWPPATPVDDGRPAVSHRRRLVEMDGTAHVILRDLTLRGTRGTALVMEDVNDVRVEACTLKNMGGWAVKMTDSQESTVIGCDVHDSGAGGILLNGGDRKTLTPGNLVAENNHIRHIGRWSPVYNSGIHLTGVGNVARHNLVHHVPHFAINLKGNDHVIELNEMHNVCSETHDAGAVHPGGGWTQRGNVIRHNFFHHLYGFEGRGNFAVALDDHFSGALVEGNVLWRVSHGISDGGGRDTHVVNNIIVDYVAGINADARGLDWRDWGFEGMKKDLERFPYKEPPWSEKYPELVDVLEDEPMAPVGSVIERNILYDGRRDIHVTEEAEPYVTVRDNFIGEDPGFVDPAAGDLRLQEDSPVLEQGFEQIPVGEIGLYEDERRASWPVEHSPEQRKRREPLHDFMQLEE
ncbi:MAG: right-handed parallel beta-helix repeat-containing protein [Planctomycetota bacterium]